MFQALLITGVNRITAFDENDTGGCEFAKKVHGFIEGNCTHRNLIKVPSNLNTEVQVC